MNKGRLSKSLFRSICFGLASKAVPYRVKTAAFGSEDSIGQKPTSRGPVIRCAKSSRVREVYSDRLQLDFQSNYKRRRPLRRGLIRSGWLTDGELESKQNRNDTEPGNPQQTDEQTERTLKTGNRSRRAYDSWWYITLTCNVRVVKRTSSREAATAGGEVYNSANHQQRLSKVSKERLRKVVGRKDLMVLTDVRNVLDCLWDMMWGAILMD